MNPNPDKAHHHALHWLILAAAALLTVGAYWPSLGRYLAFDDFPHLAPLFSLLKTVSPAGLWEAVWTSHSGPTGRPVATASVALQIGLLNADVVQLKLGNLLLHLVTGYLVYRLGCVLLVTVRNETTATAASRSLAAVCAALWLLHPMNLASVAYLVQRMNILSALFTLLALMSWIQARRSSTTLAGLVKALPVTGSWWLLGIFSKENALLLPVYVLVLEGTALRQLPWNLPPGIKRTTVRFAAMFTVVAASLLMLWWLLDYVSGGYARQPFSLPQRLLTEARVVIWYLLHTLVPDPGAMSLYHDDWRVSSGLLKPLSTLGAVLVCILLPVVALATRRHHPLLALGVLWFFAGHLLESTLLPLELVFEHRNYLPAFGPLLAVCAGAALLWQNYPRLRYVPAVMLAVVVLGLAGATWTRAQRWSDDPTERLAHLTAKTGSVRAQIEAAQIYSDLADRTSDTDRRQVLTGQMEAHFAHAASIRPDNPEPVFGWIMARYRHGNDGIDDLVGMLAGMLSNRVLTPTTVSGLHALTRCTTHGPCADLGRGLVPILQLALENRRITRIERARLLSDLARYELNVRRDHAAALGYQARAIEIAPHDITTRLDHAYIVALTGDPGTALQELRTVESLDRLHKRAHTIGQLKRAILHGGSTLQNNSHDTAPRF